KSNLSRALLSFLKNMLTWQCLPMQTVLCSHLKETEAAEEIVLIAVEAEIFTTILAEEVITMLEIIQVAMQVLQTPIPPTWLNTNLSFHTCPLTPILGSSPVVSSPPSILGPHPSLSSIPILDPPSDISPTLSSNPPHLPPATSSLLQTSRRLEKLQALSRALKISYHNYWSLV
ncbi:hypothetical protein FCV25MIE_16624, partial [Fagus crenata]